MELREELSTGQPTSQLASIEDEDEHALYKVISRGSEHYYASQRPRARLPANTARAQQIATPGPTTSSTQTSIKSSTVDLPSHPIESDDIYNRFTKRRKVGMTAVVAFCSLCSPFSTTCILSCVPEIAQDFDTTGSVINITNAAYLLMMAISPLYWGPMSQVYGRKPIYIASSFGYLIGCLGTSLSKNLVMFIVFRCLTAFAGSSFLAVGAGTIGDIYRPTERGTAMGWYLLGVSGGPAFAPVISGIIVAFRPWQDVFWLTTALGAFAFALCVFALPETSHHRLHDDLRCARQRKFVWVWVNPLTPLALFVYPNVLFGALASSAVLWNMYSLLTPIRYVINPRFDITSPALSGLFNLAPGCGYLIGTIVGGKYADYSVRSWLTKRGRRLPEDRLRSIIYMLIVVLPGTCLIYGWSIERERGGITVPVLALFFNGVAQLVVFASLNTYCVDVMQHRSTEVIGANYALRYVFAAGASSSVLPLVQSVGVGWATTIAAGLLTLSGILVLLIIWRGEKWRLAMDEWHRARTKS